MEDEDYAGRVPRSALVISTLSLFFLALTAWMTRIAIKARIQSEFGADEGLLLFAIIAFCAATGLFFSFVDQMYLVEAAIVGSLKVTPLDNATFHKSSSACLILLWTAVCGVKFSFLALFRKLVDRDCFLTSYWRWVLGLNIVVYAYGIAGFVLPCPYFKPPNSLACVSGDALARSVGLSVFLVFLDIVTDISIIAIPTIIVRKIRLCMRRKAALASCLCLSSVTVLVTIIRVSGIVATGTQSIDVIWQIYWQYVEASVAVVMASASALRSLFVTARGPRASGWHPRSASSGRSMRRMKMLPWKTRRRSRMAQHLRQPLDEDAPPIPRAHIIGSSEFFRTFSTDDIDFFDLIPGRHNPLSTRSLGSVPGYATTVSDTPSQMV